MKKTRRIKPKALIFIKIFFGVLTILILLTTIHSYKLQSEQVKSMDMPVSQIYDDLNYKKQLYYKRYNETMEFYKRKNLSLKDLNKEIAFNKSLLSDYKGNHVELITLGFTIFIACASLLATDENIKKYFLYIIVLYFVCMIFTIFNVLKTNDDNYMYTSSLKGANLQYEISISVLEELKNQIILKP